MKSRIFRAALVCLLVAGSLAACDVQTYDDAVAGIGGAPPPSPSPPPGGLTPVFSDIQAQVFTPTCTGGCHTGGAPSGQLNLEAANSFAMLVGVTSIGDGNSMRVEAFDSGNSYLIQKLEGNAGGIMPPGGMLPQADIDVIKTWIDQGAVDDTAQAPTPIRVQSLFPAPGAVVTVALTQITASFDRDPDPATVDANSFTLTASGGDGTFGEVNDMQIMAAAAPSVPGANPQTAVFNLSGIALANDTYRVTLSGSLPSPIMDMDGNMLDGENLGGMLSGDGIEGGDYVADFIVNVPPVLEANLNSIQTLVFTPFCANCHVGVMPAGSLDLSSEVASRAGLVGQPSVGDPLILRVDPMNPNGSYLIMKLEGNAGGLAMPPSGMLPSQDINVIRQWIQDNVP
jgi:hypothetical protein